MVYVSAPPPPPPPRPGALPKSAPSSMPMMLRGGSFDLMRGGGRVNNGLDEVPTMPAFHAELFPAPFQEALVSLPQQQQVSIQVALQDLEARVAHEIARLDARFEERQLRLASDNHEQEAVRKHMEELKEQNHLLRQRNFELEVHDGHLSRHIMLLQEQLSLYKDQKKQFEAVVQSARKSSNSSSADPSPVATELPSPRPQMVAPHATRLPSAPSPSPDRLPLNANAAPPAGPNRTAAASIATAASSGGAGAVAAAPVPGVQHAHASLALTLMGASNPAETAGPASSLAAVKNGASHLTLSGVAFQPPPPPPPPRAAPAHSMVQPTSAPTPAAPAALSSSLPIAAAALAVPAVRSAGPPVPAGGLGCRPAGAGGLVPSAGVLAQLAGGGSGGSGGQLARVPHAFAGANIW